MKRISFLSALFLLFTLVGSNAYGESPEVEKPQAEKTEPKEEPKKVPADSAYKNVISIDKRKFYWSGDLRYRWAKAKEGEDDARVFQQLRARLGLKADVNDDTQAIIRLATGTSAVSANQTLGDQNDPGMPRRNFGIDLAYLDWGYESLLHVWLGRIANPFWEPANTQVLWAADLAFEGAGIKFQTSGSSYRVFANLGGTMISEQYKQPTDIVDTGMVGGDAGFAFLGKDWSLTSHVGSFWFLNTQEKPITVFDKNAQVDPNSSPYYVYLGNSVTKDPNQNIYYMDNKFTLLELGSEWRQRFPASILIEYWIYFDSIENMELRGRNTAVEYGGGIKIWRISSTLSQINKESNSLIGAFTDFETNGGGTDNRGYRVTVAGDIAKNTNIMLWYLEAIRGMDTVQRKYTMTMLDFAVSF